MTVVARRLKEPNEIIRVTVDFVRWLDPGEAVTIATPTVTGGLLPWGLPGGAWGTLPALTTVPADTAPLVVVATAVSVAGNLVTLILNSGTDGVGYLVTFLASGSTSGRKYRCELEISVRDLSASLGSAGVGGVFVLGSGVLG